MFQQAAKLRKKLVKSNGFWKINAIRPEIKARRGRMRKYNLGLNAKLGGLVKELGFLFVTQFMSLEPSKITTQNGEEWGTFHHKFLIPQTATFCIVMDAKKESSFAAKIKNGVRNMRSTFNILFYVNKSKEKNGVVPVMGRVTINGTQSQFSCKKTIPLGMWDVKGNCAKGRSKF